MAILHSRFRRVFYLIPNSEDGALGDSYSLHLQGNVNHKFGVFRSKLECPIRSEFIIVLTTLNTR